MKVNAIDFGGEDDSTDVILAVINSDDEDASDKPHPQGKPLPGDQK